MSAISCCFVWFLLGFLLGWIFNWLLRNCLCGGCKSQCGASCHTPDTKPADISSVNTLVSEPVTSVVAPEAAITPEIKPEVKAVALDKALAKAAGFNVKNENDLTVVEGIGPKINELLHADGIISFSQLASTDVTKIQAILDKAGARYRLAKPGTWPQQAALAAENRWADLKALQDTLKGGV